MAEPKDLLETFDALFDSDALARRIADRFNQSWAMQDREECKRRMFFVLRMAEELASIRKVTTFCSSWAEWAIEAVITGNTKDLKAYGLDLLSEEGFVWNVGPEDGKRYAQVYAKFRDICEEASISSSPAAKA